MSHNRKRRALAEVLSRAHQKSHYTLADVGRQIGRKPNTVHAYLTGRNEPPALVLFELARIYGADVNAWAKRVREHAQSRRRALPPSPLTPEMIAPEAA